MQKLERNQLGNNGVRDLILSAGHTIGNVWFYKRENGKLRRMSYRLHVTHPTYVKGPKNNTHKNLFNQKHNQLTVFDCNIINHYKNGKMRGRGNYRTVPLENVIRISVNGMIYRII